MDAWQPTLKYFIMTIKLYAQYASFMHNMQALRMTFRKYTKNGIEETTTQQQAGSNNIYQL